jgi:hypothetical protein
VRVLDLLYIVKDADGSYEAFESHEFTSHDTGAMRDLGSEVSAVLAEEDVDAIAAALDPDTVAAVLVWENTWAAPFAMAIRRSGGQLVTSGRIPVQAILAAMEAEEADLKEGV